MGDTENSPCQHLISTQNAIPALHTLHDRRELQSLKLPFLLFRILLISRAPINLIITTSNNNLSILYDKHVCLSALYTLSHFIFTTRTLIFTFPFCQ